MRLSWLCVISSALVFIFIATSFADESLQLLYTITPNRDSTKITSITPVGDFNSDGYGDLLIGMAGPPADPYEVAKIYYGGPVFDTEPDLIFADSDPQNTINCPGRGDFHTLYGWVAAGMGDYNGDGFDDIAISAYGQCFHNVHEGEIFLYLGGPNADTICDLKMYGRFYTDCLGREMFGGDYNGDGLGDLLTYTTDHYYGQRVLIYLGGSNPDTTRRWLYDYTYHEDIQIYYLYSGFDINGDGIDDFGWEEYPGEGMDAVIFMSDYYQPGPPADSLHRPVTFFGDISLDGIDDLITTGYGDTSHLYLGGNPFNYIPDYTMPPSLYHPGNISCPGAIYHMSGDRKALLLDRNEYLFNLHQLELYNLGVPFDSVPIAIFDYGYRHYIECLDIGDINSDGTDEIALCDSTNTEVNIYTIVTTGISDDSNLPKAAVILRAYPNPFNSSTSIGYDLPKASNITLAIFDILGRKVATLIDGHQAAGHHEAIWNAGTNSSGIYFAKASSQNNSSVIKLIYLK